MFENKKEIQMPRFRYTSGYWYLCLKGFQKLLPRASLARVQDIRYRPLKGLLRDKERDEARKIIFSLTHSRSLRDVDARSGRKRRADRSTRVPRTHTFLGRELLEFINSRVHRASVLMRRIPGTLGCRDVVRRSFYRGRQKEKNRVQL